MTTITRQANFLLPEDVLNELKTSVPVRQQSKVVTEAIRKELKRIKLAKTLGTSFGAWKGKDHPELSKGTETFVRGIRSSTRMRRVK
jgi:hypothetical protein